MGGIIADWVLGATHTRAMRGGRTERPGMQIFFHEHFIKASGRLLATANNKDIVITDHIILDPSLTIVLSCLVTHSM